MVRPLHPKERARCTRRAFLRRAAVAGLAMPSLAAILSACGTEPPPLDDTSTVSGTPFGVGGIGGAPYPLARPDAPVTWHVDDSRLVASDAEPERDATVRILRWPSSLAPSVIRSFERRYRCTVEETEFTDMDDGLAMIGTGDGGFDLLVGMNVWALARSIAAGVLRPINLDHVPNLSANCWGAFQSPFYDVGSRYSVPYSVWSTGILWRNDKLPNDVAGMANPYDMFWTDAPVNKTHLLADAQDVLAMAMFRRGLTDVNDVDEATVMEARESIAQIVDATHATFDDDAVDVPKGTAWLHQSWSASVSDAVLYLPGHDEAESLSYVWPLDSGVPGSVDNDLLVLLDAGRAPVLAHKLLDHILDARNAMRNVSTWTGSQMPQKMITREALVDSGIVPEHLANVFLVEADIERGSRKLELPPAMDAVWRSAYAELTAGA